LLQKVSRGFIVSQLLYLAVVVVVVSPHHWRKRNMTSSYNNVCKLSSSSSLCELEDDKLYGMMQEKMALRSLQV
jgi:hypothetical protein